MLKAAVSEEKNIVKSKVYHFGEFSFNGSDNTLSARNANIPLAPKPSQFLALLLEHAGELVSNNRLIEHIWGNSIVDYQQNLHYSAKMVRKVLKDDASAPKYIETVPRKGYRFIGQLTDNKNNKLGHADRIKWVYWPVVLLLVVGIFAFIYFQNQTDLLEQDRKWVNAAYLLKQPDPDNRQQGLILTAELVDQYPQSAKTHALHAKALLYNQKDALAIESEIKKALELDSDEPLAWHQSGQWKLFRLQQPREALQDLTRAVTLDPDNTESLYNLSLALFINGDMQGAINRLEYAGKLDPISSQIHGDLGWYYIATGQIDKAKKECSQTLTLLPKDHQTHKCLMEVALLHYDQNKALHHALQIAQSVNATEEEQNTIRLQWRITQEKAFFRWYAAYYEQMNQKPGWHSVPLAVAYIRLGDKGEAQKIVREVKKSGHPVFMFMPQVPELAKLVEQI